MWTFTQHGFISAVQHFEDHSKIVVRSRDKQSLEMISNLFDLEVLETPGNDYPFRVIASRDQYTSYLMTEVDLLDYTNFKSRLHVSRGDDFYDAATRVWGVMHDIEDEDARMVRGRRR